MDIEKIQFQLSALQERLKKVVSELSLLDERRLTTIEHFLKETEVSRDLQLYSDFQEPTEQSIAVIDQFDSIYLQMLGYILLLEENHHSGHFQSLLASYQLMEKKIEKIKKLRQKEVRYIQILRGKNILSWGVRLKYIRSGMERLLQRTLGSEIMFMLLVVNLAQKGEEELRHLQEVIQNEEKKETLKMAVSGTLFLIPAVGTALYFLSDSLITWLNKFTPNYRRLQKLLKKTKE